MLVGDRASKKDKNEEWHLQLSYVLHIHQMYTYPHKHVYTYTDTQAVLYYTFCLVYLCGRARAEKEQNHIKIRDNGDNFHTRYYWDCWKQFLNLNLLIVTFKKKISTTVQKAISLLLSPISQLFPQMVLTPDIPMKIPCSECESRGSWGLGL